jgi:hypothetical protein
VVFTGALLATAHAACSQEVIAVGTAANGNGNGTVGPVGPVSVSSAGGADPCATPPPVGEVNAFGGTASVGTGLPFTCISDSEDEAGNVWSVECTFDGCSCSYNGSEICTCSFDPPSEICMSHDPCCGDNWPSPP